MAIAAALAARNRTGVQAGGRVVRSVLAASSPDHRFSISNGHADEWIRLTFRFQPEAEFSPEEYTDLRNWPASERTVSQMQETAPVELHHPYVPFLLVTTR